ncbi:hypothetical protein TNIN_51941 [Trichonephila inaurata madagascariensis]|uniref:Uncharacterized protein n=1 Tax=Trichonephila inaurata madagascariensis TaxID=2747483 RepID=A0A8X6XVG8_9ARAC|nr:hypothetical protein TNIN_51941 [Trichonephila inaurata madagascariensis]
MISLSGRSVFSHKPSLGDLNPPSLIASPDSGEASFQKKLLKPTSKGVGVRPLEDGQEQWDMGLTFWYSVPIE